MVWSILLRPLIKNHIYNTVDGRSTANQLTASLSHCLCWTAYILSSINSMCQVLCPVMSRHVQTVGTFWLTFGSTSFMTLTCFEAADWNKNSRGSAVTVFLNTFCPLTRFSFIHIEEQQTQFAFSILMRDLRSLILSWPPRSKVSVAETCMEGPGQYDRTNRTMFTFTS